MVYEELQPAYLLEDKAYEIMEQLYRNKSGAKWLIIWIWNNLIMLIYIYDNYFGLRLENTIGFRNF